MGMTPLNDDSEPVLDTKFICFKRQEFYEWLANLTTRNLAAESSPGLLEESYKLALEDAVVIRRQDVFASPALATYANCIALTARLMTNDRIRQAELLEIADYFQRQSEMAGDEAYKLPD